MKGQEQDQKDIFQIAGKSIKPAAEIVASGASETKKATGSIFSLLFRSKFSRILHDFYNRPVRRRLEQKYGRT